MGEITVSDGDPADKRATKPYRFRMFQMSGDGRCLYYGCSDYVLSSTAPSGPKPKGVVRVNVDDISQYGADGQG